MRNVLALRLLTTLTVLSLLSTASFMVPAHAQEQYSITTDRLVYNIGENVTIYVSPAPPNFGVYPWIVVTKPDRSQMHLDLKLWSNNMTLGQASTTLVADILGQYTVDLWLERSENDSVVLNPTPRLMATCYFQAVGKRMNFVGEGGCCCAPLSCQQSCRPYIVVAVQDADNQSPVAGAVISIQANVMLGSSYLENPPTKGTITYTNVTATAYTNATGQFQFALPVPFSPNSTAFCTGTEWFPHYIITLVANKAGYEPAGATMHFPPTFAPDISMEASASKLIVAQGRSGLVTVTVHDYIWDTWVINQSLLGLAAINLPEGVTVQFSPPSLPGREWSTIDATVYVSYNAPVGDHAITIQTVPGEAHRICIQLIVTPMAPMWVIALVCVGAAIIVSVAIAVIRSRGRHD